MNRAKAAESLPITVQAMDHAQRSWHVLVFFFVAIGLCIWGSSLASMHQLFGLPPRALTLSLAPVVIIMVATTGTY